MQEKTCLDCKKSLSSCSTFTFESFNISYPYYFCTLILKKETSVERRKRFQGLHKALPAAPAEGEQRRRIPHTITLTETGTSDKTPDTRMFEGVKTKNERKVKKSENHLLNEEILTLCVCACVCVCVRMWVCVCVYVWDEGFRSMSPEARVLLKNYFWTIMTYVTILMNRTRHAMQSSIQQRNCTDNYIKIQWLQVIFHLTCLEMCIYF